MEKFETYPMEEAATGGETFIGSWQSRHQRFPSWNFHMALVFRRSQGRGEVENSGRGGSDNSEFASSLSTLLLLTLLLLLSSSPCQQEMVNVAATVAVAGVQVDRQQPLTTDACRRLYRRAYSDVVYPEERSSLYH